MKGCTVGEHLARPPSKTIVQPDQHELFAKRIRARFADLGTIGKISLSLTTAIMITIFSVLSSVNEDFWLRPALTSACAPIFVLFVLAVVTECCRSMRWTERKDIFAAAHFLTILGTLGVVGFLLVRYDAIAENRAIERATAAQTKAAESRRAWQTKVAEEAHAAEAARKAEEECQKARSAATDIATRRKADAWAALKRCKQQFERDKTIFTTSTADAHCKARQRAIAVANEDLKVANALVCAPAATGSTPAPR
jgi:hypothetical protein